MVSENPFRDFDEYEAEKHREFIQLPICDCCGERIVEEHLYDFDGELVCEECLLDYVRENFRKKTEDYMED